MLGEFTLFSWKSKSTQMQEAEAYEKWAFPFGGEQRKKLEALLVELFPKENAVTALIPFLTCKELFEQVLKNKATEDAAVDHMLNELKKYKQVVRKREMPMYLAAVLADRQVGYTLDYPSADSVRKKAGEIEMRRTKK